MSENPFKGPCYNGHQLYNLSGDERTIMVKTFTAEQCAAALEVPGLQKTVERAIRARQRKLGTAAV